MIGSQLASTDRANSAYTIRSKRRRVIGLIGSVCIAWIGKARRMDAVGKKFVLPCSFVQRMFCVAEEENEEKEEEETEPEVEKET